MRQLATFTNVSDGSKRHRRKNKVSSSCPTFGRTPLCSRILVLRLGTGLEQ